jgi:hypothetical protein
LQIGQGHTTRKKKSSKRNSAKIVAILKRTELKKNNLFSRIGNSIVEARSQFTEIAEDMTEVAIDSVMKDGIAKDIPVVGIGTKLLAVGNKIRGEWFLRSVKLFVDALDDVSDEKVAAFLEEMQSDKYEKKVGITLLVILDRMDDEQKPLLIGRYFAAYLQREISFEVFQRIARIIERIYLPDLKELKNFYPYRSLRAEALAMEGLLNSGLIEIETNVNMPPERIQSHLNQDIIFGYHITKIGEAVITIGTKFAPHFF